MRKSFREPTKEVEVSIVVEVEEQKCAARLHGRRGDGRGRVRERDFGRALVHEVCFRAGRGERFGVAPLFEVVRADGGRRPARSQRLKLLHQALPLLALAPAYERRAEVVERRPVVRLLFEREAQRRDGLGELALLHVELAELHVRAHVARVELQHALEGGGGVIRTVLLARDEAEDVLGLRRVGRSGGGGFGLLLRRDEVGHVVERDGEIDARERELGVERERAAELVGPLLVLELFEERDAEVVGAVSLFTRAPRRGRLHGRLLRQR